jgi:hypothetical protein
MKEGRKKERKKERKYFVCSVKEIRRTVSSPTGIEPGSSLIQSWIVIVLLTKPLFELHKNYRILNWTKYSHVLKYISCGFVMFSSHSASVQFKYTEFSHLKYCRDSAHYFPNGLL